MQTYRAYRDRLALGQPKAPPTDHKNNHEVTKSGGTKLPETGSQEASAWIQVPESGGEGQQRAVQVDLSRSSRPSVSHHCQADGLILQEERRPEGGSLAPVPLLEFLPEVWKRFNIDGPRGQGSATSPTSSETTPTTPER